MAYISDLAEELNRQEWAVEKMLKNRGYLKQNGEPRKSTIEDGLMREDGFIYKKGWDIFVDELGYIESDDDEDKLDDTKNKYDSDKKEDSENKDESNDYTLPEIRSNYHGWVIFVAKDEAHKYVITAILYNDEEYEQERIEINGDEIAKYDDPETVIIEKIDEREDEKAEERDWEKNYRKYMNIPGDYDDSNDPD